MSRSGDQRILKSLEKLPRARLATLPTPLEKMPNLSKRLGGPNLYIKRDDLISVAFGGTKIRALEYILGDAYAKGSDAIIVKGSMQGNWPMEVAAGARKLGMQATIVTKDPTGQYYPPHIYESNMLLNRITGAKIKVVADNENIEDVCKKLAKRLEDEGQKPYIVSHTALWVAGMVNAISELLCQAKEHDMAIDYIVHASSYGGTQAGLLLGTKVFHTDIEVVGISDGLDDKTSLTTRIAEIANQGAILLGTKVSTSANNVILFDDYVGNGHGMADENAIRAIRLVAETEGVFLDQLYTGRAMAGVIDLIRKGYFRAEANIVFVHTGGMAMLFAFREPISDVLEARKLSWTKPPWIP